MKNILLSLLILSAATASACLNGETKELKNGTFLYEDRESPIPYGHDFHIENFPKLLAELDRLYSETKDLDYLSDKGYVLTIQGKYREALAIYQFIEKTSPNRYSTASNMGTINELLGENRLALEWISKAVRLNPKSHEGSEWLHVNILKAKIAGPKSITSGFLIETGFGDEMEPKTMLSDEEIKQLQSALFYQLNERMSFIKDKDPIIAQLLTDLANLYLLSNDYYIARDIFLSAVDYGASGKLLSNRLSVTNEAINERFYKRESILYDHNQYHQNLFVITLIVSLVVIAFLVFILFRFKRQNKHRSLPSEL